MPRGITRARAPAVPSLYGYPPPAAACSMPGAIGWAPALLPSRGGVIAHPKVQSRNSDSARCDWEIEEVAEAALLPVAPTLRSGKLDRPVKYRFFRRCDILAIRDLACRDRAAGVRATGAGANSWGETAPRRRVEGVD